MGGSVSRQARRFCEWLAKAFHPGRIALRQRLRRSCMIVSPPNKATCPDSSSSRSTIEGKISLVRGSPNPLEAPAPRKMTVLLILFSPLLYVPRVDGCDQDCSKA